MSLDVPAKPLQSVLALKLPITIYKQPLADSETGVREQVRQANQMRYSYEMAELQHIDSGALSVEEVLTFLELLPKLPKETHELLRKHPIDLDDPPLKLYYGDGFGLRGLKAGFKLVLANGAWHLEPQLHAPDIVADLEVANRAYQERKAQADQAENDFYNHRQGTPAYNQAFAQRTQTAERLRGIQRAKLVLLKQLEQVLPKGGTLAGYDAAKLKAEKQDLEAALVDAPPPAVGHGP